MRLSPYLKLLTPDEREFFAERCGTTAKYLREIADGRRRARPELADRIEEKSSGIVTKKELMNAVEEAAHEKQTSRVQDENQIRKNRK